MENENLLLSNCCETFALDAPLCFIGSFPGVIVFGKVSKIAFIEEKCFKFTIFELYKLYLSIVNILAFYTNTKDSDQALIHTSNNDNYFWSGRVVETNGKKHKIVKFGIEKNDNVIMDICFTLKQFQHFFFTLEKVIISSMCLQEKNEQLFVEFIMKISSQSIQNMDKMEELLKAAETYLKEKNVVDSQLQHFFNIIIYYHEVLIMLVKLKSLQMPNFRRSVVQQII